MREKARGENQQPLVSDSQKGKQEERTFSKENKRDTCTKALSFRTLLAFPTEQWKRGGATTGNEADWFRVFFKDGWKGCTSITTIKASEVKH